MIDQQKYGDFIVIFHVFIATDFLWDDIKT